MTAALKTEQELLADQLEKLAENSKSSSAATLINASVLISVLWGLADNSLLLLWFLALVPISMVRIYLQKTFNKFKSTEKSLHAWKNYYHVTLLITGVIWGGAGIVLFPANSVAHQTFIAFVLGGMVAGSVGVFSVMSTAFLAFSVPALIPLTIQFFLINDPIHLAMGFMLLIFWIIMFLTARRLNKDIVKLFSLKYKNIDLISALETEVETRKRAERELTEQKNEIEKIVNLRTRELQDVNVRLTNEIEDRKRVSRALKESEEKYKDLVENINDVIYSLDTQGVITYINPVVESRFGYNPSEIIGENFSKFIYKDDFQLVMSRFDDIVSGKLIETEYRLVSKTGACRWVRSSTRTVHKDGDLCGFTGSFIDISERKRFEAERAQMEKALMQSQKMESIGTLAGGIAHDFNNILSSVIGYTELALGGVEKGGKIEDFLQKVYAAGERAKDLVKQILTFARKSEEEITPVRVDIIIKEVIKFIRSSIPTTIEIRQNIVSKSPIMGNTTQMHQVMMNLCTNAAQAMEDNGGILDIRLTDFISDETPCPRKLELIPGNYIEIKVSDTGMGIAPDIVDSIFEPYFTTKIPGEGTGLGLATVHGIVKTYGGKIMVESMVGEGTTFKIYLPTTGKQTAQRSLSQGSETLLSGSERILVVDDEAVIAHMNGQILKQAGYSVTTKTASIESLELFRSKSEDFDLVICDMTMPNMTGDVLAVELMKIRPDIPVILYTGYSKKISDETASEIGIKAFAYKPIDKSELYKIVRTVLDDANLSIPSANPICEAARQHHESKSFV